jgi:sRNA-binding regulator protein Hfq
MNTLNKPQAQRQTIGLNGSTKPRTSKPKRVAKPLAGHEYTLHTLKESGDLVYIIVMNQDQIKAKVIDFDKYAVCVEAVNGEATFVTWIFKHAIESFGIVK